MTFNNTVLRDTVNNDIRQNVNQKNDFYRKTH